MFLIFVFYNNFIIILLRCMMLFLVKIKYIMKNLLYLFFAITLLGCSSDDDSSQKFRTIYEDTFWQLGDGLLTFSPDKLFYEYVENRGDDDSTSDGTFYKEGSFDNVPLNDCIFGNITYIVIEEDNDTLSLRSIQSNGSGSSPCTYGEFNVVFQIINENAMEYTLSEDQYTETYTAVRSSRSFSTNDCVNGTLNGQAWW
jgi:hypothetical protein